MPRVPLRALAHSRTGDKGDSQTLSLIAWDRRDYDLLREAVTPEAVARHFAGVVTGPVTRHELPLLHAFNFVLEGALAGGVNDSLALDTHGKSRSSLFLAMEIDVPDAHPAGREPLSETTALRHLSDARRDATDIPGLPAETRARTVGRVGVVGGGTMGRGIALSLLNAGLPTVLVETGAERLGAARRAIGQVYESSVAKGHLDQPEVERRIALLRPTLDDGELGDCDLVIEAVYEDLDLKRSVCRRLGEVCRPGAIVATNTSTLDVDDLAQATGRPADVIGLHFFSPAHIMRLVEVVRGGATSPDVLLTALGLVRALGKQPVVSGMCWGFIGNRMLEPYLREAEFLMLEGASPAAIDGAMEAFGMAMGPCRMLDLAGVDVSAKTVIEQERSGRLPADPSYRVVARRLLELGRLGQKTRHGFYRYEGRTAVPDPDFGPVAADLARRHAVATRGAIEPAEIVERLLLPLVNEGARIVAEGVAYRASDIDVVWTSGYGFPEGRGGPMFHAETVGLAHVVDRLRHYARTRGNEHGYWSVAPLLARLAATGGGFRVQA